MDRSANDSGPRDPLEALVEEYFRVLRRGEPADAAAFAARLPGREREFHELVETLRLLESSGDGRTEAGAEARRERVGRFRLLRQIGRGGMGVVFEAIDESLDRSVALKLLPSHASLDEREVARFRREAHAAARLNHPHIVPIFGVGEDDGVHWLAMQMIRGESLERLLRRARDEGRRPLPPSDVVRHAIAIADALVAAHAEGVLHRDVKPSNLLLDESGEIWVTDFGLAKAEGSASITRTGETVGTPRYMPPEAFSGWADPRSDVWGLGATLYEMLAGRPAFDGADRAQLLRQISDVEPAALRRVDRTLPRDLATIVHKCLQKEPNARYASARELADDLRRCAAGEPIRARPPSLAYRGGLIARRHPTATTLLVVALAGGVAASWSEATRAHAAEARERRRFDEVRKLAESFLFEFHDAIQNLPGSTKARELVVKRALEYLDRLAQESADDPALRRELATAYQKVGDVQGNPYQPNLGDVAGARKSYATAIALLDPLVTAGTASDEDRALLAAIELSGGGIALAQGDTKGALALSERGLALRKELAAARPNAERRQDLSTAYQYHAFNLSAVERTEEELAALEQQRLLLADLLAAAPSDTALRRHHGQNRYLVAVALQRKSDLGGARAAYAEAIEVERRLLDADPDNTLLRRDLFWTCNDRGGFFSCQGDSAAALEDYEEVREISEKLVAADPKSVDARLLLATARMNLGDTLVDLDREDEALDPLEEALAGCRALVDGDPTNNFARGRMAAVYESLGRANSRGSDPATLPTARDDFREAVEILEAMKANGHLLGADASELESAKEHLAACEARLAKDAPGH
jgi:tetratricopeptide (TPR) repeat protein